MLIAGRFMVDPGMVRVIGRSPFHDLVCLRLLKWHTVYAHLSSEMPNLQKLASTGELAYLGHQWRRSIACAGGDLPMQGDISARTLIFNVPDVDPSRRQRLIDLLDIDLDWHMHCVSDGQRRRVQICMGLLKPFKVLLMDEVSSRIVLHRTRYMQKGSASLA